MYRSEERAAAERSSRSGAQARGAWLLFLLLMLGGCGQGGQILRVFIGQTLSPENPMQVLLLLNGQRADQRISIPWISVATLGHTYSFVLQLPADAVGTLDLALAHFGTNGCLRWVDYSSLTLRGGNSTQDVQVPGYGVTGFSLVNDQGTGTPFAHPMICPPPEGIPALAFVELTAASQLQPGGTLTIDGWGLLPGCTFTINGVAAEVVRWHSPLRVEVRVPAAVSAIPPISINVQNPDGESDTRTDLIRSM